MAGRPVYVGYLGWLWTRGINYTEREQQLKAFYLDPKYNVKGPYFGEAKFVLLDSTAIVDWNASEETFDSNFTRVFSNNTYSLYKIQ